MPAKQSSKATREEINEKRSPVVNDNRDNENKNIKTQQNQTPTSNPSNQTKYKDSKPKGTKKLSPNAPIYQRKSDLFFVVTYLTLAFVFFTVLLARCNKILPQAVLDVKVAESICTHVAVLEEPLKHITESYHSWGKHVFPAKASVALTIANRANCIVLLPLSLLLAFGFFKGASWTKNWTLIHSSIMLYSMAICDSIGWEALLKNELKLSSHDPALLFLVSYGFFTFFPLAAILRVWQDEPFKRQTGGHFLTSFMNNVLTIACFAWLLTAVISYYEFAIKTTEIVSHYPSFVEHTYKAWEATAPHREKIVSTAAEYTGDALEYAQQGANVAGEYAVAGASKVGEWIDELGHMIVPKDKKE